MPFGISPLLLGKTLPPRVTERAIQNPIRGWSFANDLNEDASALLWKRFLPDVSVDHDDPTIEVSLFHQKVVEIQLSVRDDNYPKLDTAIELALIKRFGKPIVTHLPEVENFQPAELLRRWKGDEVTLLLVSSQEYGRVFVVMRLNAFAKRLPKAKADYSDTFWGRTVSVEAIRW